MPQAEFRKVVLENGVTLVMERHAQVRGVSIGVWVKVGSCFENAFQNGISHFLEHMVFKGTETRNPFEISWTTNLMTFFIGFLPDLQQACAPVPPCQLRIERDRNAVPDFL